MISKLTTEQEAQIPLYIKKWVDQASVPMDEAKAIQYTKKMYVRMEEKEPILIIGDSPLTTCLLAAIYFSLFKKKKDSQLRSQLDSQLYSQLDSQLGSQLRSQLDSQLYSQLYSQLDSQLYSQLDSQLDSQLYSQLYSQLDSQLGSQLGSQLDSQLDSQLSKLNSDWYLGIYWLIWCGWYEYGKMIGVKFDESAYEMFVNFNSEVNFIVPYKGVCFISRKPTEIHWKGRSLHNEKGGAVKYADGYSMFMLNGIRMEKKHIETPAEKLDVQEIIEESNVDVRRELIRKIGIERFVLKAGAKVLDKSGDYELLSIKLSDKVPDARYLKMRNPSIGIFHVEGVEGDTVQEAINFRAGLPLKGGLNWEPSILT